MMVLILRNVRPGFRGRLTGWLVQPQTGIYVGHLSGRIRDRLWERVCEEIDLKGGAGVLIHPSNSEQGYAIRTHGQTQKDFVDFEGLILPKTARKRA